MMQVDAFFFSTRQMMSIVYLYLMIQPITWPVSNKNLIELEEI